MSNQPTEPVGQIETWPSPYPAGPDVAHWPDGFDPAVPAVPLHPDLPVPPGGKMVTLPSGYRVVLRSTRSIRNRERASIFEGADFQADRMLAAFRILANIERLLITAWDVRDFDDHTGEPVGDVLPIPAVGGVSVLDLLALEDAATLDGEAEAVQKLLMPNFEPNPDPASPTQPSGV